MSDIYLRIVTEDDAKEILAIYEYYVKNTAITFEYDLPCIQEFKSKIRNTSLRYPYIAAVKDREIIGYAYTGPFVGRAAYQWSCETAIYLEKSKRRLGAGRLLYQALEKISQIQNIINLNACIGYPQFEDEYLNKDSFLFHQHMGFSWVGEFHQCGYKFGRWYNMIWMEKILSRHIPNPSPVIPFASLSRKDLQDAGVLC